MTNHINLDDPETYKHYDPEGMLGRIKEMPRQCQQAWQAAMDFDLPEDYAEVDSVVILGMGGSAIGGDLVRSLAEAEAKVPVLVYRDYGLPAYVDDRTLVITSSYSGNTEETLSAFNLALKKGAKKLVLTTGGTLLAMAGEKNIPAFKITYKAQPRAALGFSFLPTFCFLQKLGFLKDKSADVAETVKILEGLSARMDDTVSLSSNPAKKLAQRLYGCLPVIYGAGILAEVAHRWKTQVNENSKSWAFYEVFPELNHNATVGYQFPAELARRILVVLLRSPSLNPRISLRYEVTSELLDRSKISHEFADSEGKSILSQMMSLVLFGDFVSYYLALLYRIDPSPVKVIDYLKERLAKG
ncbi:MAG: bifunctional phosphoglucose/phosphomannose isomerase [Chloroflexi bacterium RBG_16_50_9]|nr:MAG: bifunctional phosphoglucose/phosphomannose isomerase [Chloroflexi bacterium RBG_16_50_9]